jgi:D-cysteine desulfhydrase
LGESLGLDSLWIKRDDLTGLAFGGNKTRKLEYVVGDAKAQKCDTLVTVGALQSNHCRQTAAAAAATGMRCILLLAGEEPEVLEGNLLLSRMMGAEIKYYPDESLFTLRKHMDEVMATLEDFGLKPYAIPEGAAMAVGCVSYAVAMEELRQQMQSQNVEFSKILIPVGTGGTHAGMLVGAQLLGIDTEVIGIAVAADARATEERIRDLVDKMVSVYSLEPFEPDIRVDDSFLGKGYAKVDDSVRSALEMFAKMDAIILDPVYTGKAGVALMRMALNGDIAPGEPTLFYHTGGQPALFAF